MCPRVASRHPSQELSVIDDEVGKRELMRVEQEWCDDEGHDGEPEVDHVPGPHRQSCKEQNDDRSNAQVDGWPRETRVEDAE